MAEEVMSKEITKETYIDWLKTMELIREFEIKAQMLYGRQKIRGFLHLYIGQEAVAAGTFSAIGKDDKVITAYRDHGHALAAGMDPKHAMAELFGKKDGCSKGKGGSMHFFSKKLNFFGGHGIVGAAIPMGAGIAFAEKYRDSGNICVNFFGDGAAMQGALHETFNMSMTWGIPCLFIIENNLYGMGTAINRITNVPELYKLGGNYNMPSEQVDGMDVVAVHNAVEKAAAHIRKEGTPYLLEIQTYRYKGHSISDPAKYRTNEEVDEFKGKDPINKVIVDIKEKGHLTEEGIKEIKDNARARVKEAIQFAEESPFPEPADMYDDVYIQKDYPYLKD